MGILKGGQMFLGLTPDVKHAFLHQDDIIAGIGIAAAVQGMVRAVRDKGFSGQFPKARLAVLSFTVFVNGPAPPNRGKFLP